jgi:hypothetical protein
MNSGMGRAPAGPGGSRSIAEVDSGQTQSTALAGGQTWAAVESARIATRIHWQVKPGQSGQWFPGLEGASGTETGGWAVDGDVVASPVSADPASSCMSQQRHAPALVRVSETNETPAAGIAAGPLGTNWHRHMPEGMSRGSTATRASTERAIGIPLIPIIDKGILILDPSMRQPGRPPPPRIEPGFSPSTRPLPLSGVS